MRVVADARFAAHDAYLNIAKRQNVAFVDRHAFWATLSRLRFLAYASAMRGLVIDYARRRRAKRRGRQLHRDWREARMLLHHTLRDPGAPDETT